LVRLQASNTGKLGQKSGLPGRGLSSQRRHLSLVPQNRQRVRALPQSRQCAGINIETFHHFVQASLGVRHGEIWANPSDTSS
jgi:hypothetical protein